MKDFDKWNTLKKKTENKNAPHVSVGCVYWCRFGINIGTEFDGKNEKFSRPVLVLKKYSNDTLFVLPLTTKIHNGDWYFNTELKNTKAQIILNQGKTIDAKRLEEKICELSQNVINNIYDSFIKLLRP